MTTATEPTTTPLIDAAFINDTAARLEAIETYLDDNNIVALWDQTHLDLQAEFNVRLSTSFWDSPVSDNRIYYDMSLTDPGVVTFSGTDPDNDHHTFEIPVEFIDPTTRDLAIDALRATYALKVQTNKNHQAEAAAARRAKDEADFQRLGRELGHLPG